MKEPYDFVVVGGGPSGLAYAMGVISAATRRGASPRVCVVEAGHHAGGWAQTRKVGAYTLETGPYGYLDKHPELGRMVELLGLTSAVRHPSPAARNRYVYVRGGLRRMPRGPLSFLFSRILTLRGKLRLLREPWAAPHPGGDESVAAFARRRLGVEAAENLVVPMFTGIYAGDPDGASLASCFPRMAELEREHGGLFRALWRLRKKVRQSGQGVGAPRGELTSFQGGLGTLVEALVGWLGSRVRLDSAVTAIERTENGYRVVIEGREAICTSRLVVATPARQAALLLHGLGAPLVGPLGGIPYAGVAVVHTAYGPEAARRIPPGFGFLVPRTAKRSLLGSVFVSTIFPDQAPRDEVLLRTVIGGRQRPDLVERDNDALLALVAQEHRKILGVTDRPRFQDVARYPNSLPQYDVGHGALIDSLERGLKAFPGLHITGNGLRGIGLADCLAHNFARGERDFDASP